MNVNLVSDPLREREDDVTKECPMTSTYLCSFQSREQEDPTIYANYRGISLFNFAYNFLSTLLCERENFAYLGARTNTNSNGSLEIRRRIIIIFFLTEVFCGRCMVLCAKRLTVDVGTLSCRRHPANKDIASGCAG